jgi:hypothetical protein
MEFPSDFPPRSRAIVEAEELRASRDFDQASKALPWSQHGPTEELAAEVRQYILRTYSAFVVEACSLEGVWPIDRVRSYAREFLERLTFRAWSEKGYDTGGRVYGGQIRHLPEMTSHVSGAILPNVMREFVKSRQWRECEEALLRLAEAQIAKGITATGAEAGAAPPKIEADSSGKVDVTHRLAPRRRGFAADMARHEKIAAVMDRHAPGCRIRSTAYRNQTVLEKICRNLDEVGVDIPKSWKNGRPPSLAGVKVRNWEEALELGSKKLVADQLRTSLVTIRRHAEARPCTIST